MRGIVAVTGSQTLFKLNVNDANGEGNNMLCFPTGISKTNISLVELSCGHGNCRSEIAHI